LPVAIVPEAPPTFSMMMLCPSVCCMRAVTMRAMVSVGPPALAGTVTVIGRVG
jgi:hypothetical protein